MRVSKASPDRGRGMGAPHAAAGHWIHLLSDARLSPFKGWSLTLFIFKVLKMQKKKFFFTRREKGSTENSPQEPKQKPKLKLFLTVTHTCVWPHIRVPAPMLDFVPGFLVPPSDTPTCLAGSPVRVFVADDTKHFHCPSPDAPADECLSWSPQQMPAKSWSRAAETHF